MNPHETAASQSSISKPLNERLYRLLVAKFGRVKIANQGESMVGRPVSGTDGHSRWITSHAGEYYRVCHAECGDRRFRLWINHRFGTFEESIGQPLNWLACCYNCRFEANLEKRAQFERYLFGFHNREERAQLARRFTVSPGVLVNTQALSEARLPGIVQSLASLNSSHPAVAYVRDRGFDVEEAAHVWDAGYCLEAPEPYEICTHRLIIPVYFREKLVGWQARALTNGSSVKYYTMPGLAKSRMLYNYDRAVESRVVVVVEGALDAWKVGLPAVALFGKALSHGQKAVLAGGWPRKRDPLLVVMLDPEAGEEADKLMEECLELFPKRRVKVVLPEGTDPGSLTRDEIWDFIDAATGAAGLGLEDFLGELGDVGGTHLEVV